MLEAPVISGFNVNGGFYYLICQPALLGDLLVQFNGPQGCNYK